MSVKSGAIIVVVFCLGGAWVSTGEAAEPSPPVLLRWKIPADGAIGFRTTMDAVTSEKDAFIKIDMAKLAGAGTLPPELAKGLAALELPKSFSMTTVLQRLPNENFSARLIVGNVARPRTTDSEMQKKLEQMWRQMEGTVQLRGQLTPSGKVASFYLNREQQNLLALFFQLPEKPVKVGEAWPLDVNLISMGSEFICDEAERKNRVTLVSLKDEGGDRVATLDYTIAESVNGRVYNPFDGKVVRSAMSIGFVGRGEFLVNRGAWKKFVGRMKMQSSGVMDSQAYRQFAMEPLGKIPEELLALE